MRVGLSKRAIVDKNGKRTFVWVRTNKKQTHGQGQSKRRGASEGASKEARYYGRNAIEGRGRTQSEKTASRERAKAKLSNPSTNAPLKAANRYNTSAGLPEIKPHKFKPSDKVLQPKISDEYLQLQDATKAHEETDLERSIFDSYKGEPFMDGIKNYNQLVHAAYAQLGKEVEAQYKSLPVKVEWQTGDKEYVNSLELIDDIHNFNHMYVFTGGDDHTMIGSKTKDANGITTNDKFRAVHDYFGHGIAGNQFGKDGEENAWIEHSKMLSPLAQIALTAETRGQNSVVNYSGINDVVLEKMKLSGAMRKSDNPETVAEGKKLLKEAQGEFQFAEQKAIVLRKDFTNAKRYF